MEKYKELGSNLLKNFNELGVYSDFNYFKSNEIRIVANDNDIDISKDSDCGVKLRVWDGEKFLESASTSLDESELLKLSSNLLDRYNRNEVLNKKNLKVDLEVLNKIFKTKSDLDINSLSLEEKTNKLIKLKDQIKKIDSDIVNTRVILIEEIEDHTFVNKYKKLSQNIKIVKLVLAAFVNCEDGSNRMAYSCITDNDLKVFDSINKELPKFEKEIHSLKKAKKLDGGKYQVLLSPHITGLLAHESFGHGMEADTMMKDRALASSWIGKKIGQDIVSIVDYPNIDGKHGQFYFDHEGNLAKKTYLVKNGIINEPMADLYSKTKLDLESSSNSRFESFDHKNYTRMSNTYFESGDSSFDDLLSGIEDGIYVSGSAGGMEDPKGWGVQVQGCFGQKIKNGKLINEFYDGFALTGFLPDIIKNISGVSKEFEIQGGGSCGKGHKEWVRVSEGGPYLRIDEVILG